VSQMPVFDRLVEALMANPASATAYATRTPAP
jgi:hypothetical protein